MDQQKDNSWIHRIKCIQTYVYLFYHVKTKQYLELHLYLIALALNQIHMNLKNSFDFDQIPHIIYEEDNHLLCPDLFVLILIPVICLHP
jgi:hypothetical protein